jgi:iron complex transport system substrate-binding protein
MKTILIVSVMAVAVLFAISCARFRNAPSESKETRYVVISPIYNEIIWALGAQDKVVGIDLSTTYPPEVKNVQTVGYHRALSAEGILSLHPTAIIHDNNIGSSKNNSFDGTKALIREMGVYFHKKRAQKNSATER